MRKLVLAGIVLAGAAAMPIANYVPPWAPAPTTVTADGKWDGIGWEGTTSTQPNCSQILANYHYEYDLATQYYRRGDRYNGDIHYNKAIAWLDLYNSRCAG